MFVQYPKIHTLFKRTDTGTLIVGDFSKDEFHYLRNCPWMCFEKANGLHARVLFDGKRVSCVGRKDGMELPETVAKELKKMFTVRSFKEAFDADCKEVALYVECVGKGIPGAGTDYGFDKNDSPQFVLFDVMVHDWWLKPEDVCDVAKKLECKNAEFLFSTDSVDDIVYAVGSGVESLIGTGMAEGVVAHPIRPLYFRDGERVMFKLKTKDFSNARFHNFGI